VEQLDPSKYPPSLVGELDLYDMIAMAASTPPGCFVEVGVYRGGSAWRLLQVAKVQQRELYLYDTFTGIPYKDSIDAHSVGDFKDTSLEHVRQLCPEAIITPGLFPASAVDMPRIAFAHLDCDQYRSVREAALYLSPLMIEGGVMWFDDSPCLPGAKLATLELFAERLELSRDFGKHYVRFTTGDL
jgi:Macrocin-O-methyltransferase (TylF)